MSLLSHRPSAVGFILAFTSFAFNALVNDQWPLYKVTLFWVFSLLSPDWSVALGPGVLQAPLFLSCCHLSLASPGSSGKYFQGFVMGPLWSVPSSLYSDALLVQGFTCPPWVLIIKAQRCGKRLLACLLGSLSCSPPKESYLSLRPCVSSWGSVCSASLPFSCSFFCPPCPCR